MNSVDYFDWYVWFNVGGTQTRPNAGTVNSSTLKNQIFHQDGAIAVNGQLTAVGTYEPWINKWRVEINVPRQWQQVNENDVIELVILGGNNGAATSTKCKVIYKEIFP